MDGCRTDHDRSRLVGWDFTGAGYAKDKQLIIP